MSERIASEEREFSMSRLLNAAKKDISHFFKTFRVKFTTRLTFPASRLQVEGARGGDIAVFQDRFNLFAKRYGISVPVSGAYDEETRQAVAAFQRGALYVLSADGFIGPETARVLHIRLVEG